MVFKKDKKGQAAIEFLMTYGWMLLVVLIVGALIFSFVDFGSLLPNKLDLSNSLRGSPGDSVAYSAAATGTLEASDVRVVFSYVGAKQAQVNSTSGIITNSLSSKCLSYYVKNLDTGKIGGCVSADLSAAGDCANSSSGIVPFLNGQTGIMHFTCDPAVGVKSVGSNKPTVGQLLKNDVLDGRIVIKVKNPKTGLEVASAGPIRLSINQ